MNVYSPIALGWRSNRCLNSRFLSSVLGSNEKSYCTATKTEAKPDEIAIPIRIQRSPTDILQALAGTIGRDPTAPHYKYHDDPYLIPTSTFKRREYALSQEAGRKAAHWLRQEHREYFLYTTLDPPLKQKLLYKNADPPIEAFFPKPVYDEKSEVTEDDFKIVLKNSLVSDAKTVYKLLENKNSDGISSESRQQFLEMLCFFNEEDPIGEEWIEENWYQQGKWTGNVKTPVWKEKGFAESVFQSMQDKTPEAYCALIQGMCKYYQAGKAYDLYNECLEKNIPLNTQVYNGLLSVVGFFKENFDMRWELILNLLGEMNKMKLKPNVGTLNSILGSLVTMNSNKTKGRTLEILGELVGKCGVEPSLATWYHVMCIFCKDKGPITDVLYSIMDKLEGKEITIQDPKDTIFFITAMNVCRYHLQDVNLAKRVHNLLLHGSNYNLIGDSYKESIFYRHYFLLCCTFEPLEEFMSLYNDLVPNVYIPESSVLEQLIKSIDSHGAVEHYPLIWSHIVMFGHSLRVPILQLLLESMIRNLPLENEQETGTNGASFKNELKTLGEALKFEVAVVKLQYGEEFKPPSIRENFANIAWDIWNKIEEQPELKTNRVSWTGAMLGDILHLLIQNNRLSDANIVILKLSKEDGVAGIPTSPQPLIDYIHLAVQNESPKYATMALNYLSECGYAEAPTVAKEVLSVMLDKPSEEIEELVAQASKKQLNVSSYSSDITNFISVAALSGNVREHKRKKNSSELSSTSSESSDDSGSDTSDDEFDDLHNKKK